MGMHMRVTLGRAVREPLVHFVAAGFALYAAFAVVRGPDLPQDDSSIVVDRETLLTYMQYRANAFEPETFAIALDSMPEAELAALIDAYVEEEALYREAKSLGLEASDYVIRQRMIQKIEFLLGDVAVAGTTVDESALEDYFETNRDLYAIEPSVTFTHVFFDGSRHGGSTEAAAWQAVAELNAARAAFNDAAGRGDGFLFLKNYVDRTFDYVASHFGADFAAALAELPASDDWQGPLRSAYGYHAVLLTRRTERSYPALEDVRGHVERDYLRNLTDESVEEMTRSIVSRYEVEVADVRARAQE